MILMRANPLLGPLEGVGPKKSRFSGLTPSKGLVMDVVRIKIITSRAIKTTSTSTLIVITTFYSC